MIAFGIMALGFVFLYGGKIESVVIDKDKCFLELHKRSILCCNKKRVFDLSRV